MPIDLFSKTPLADVLPKEMQKVVEELKKSSSQEECLRRAYGILISKYQGKRLKTFTKFFNVFENDAQALWDKEGFMHCTNINYLMRILLVKSRFFCENDICLKWTQIWFVSPHQYLKIKAGEKWIDIDVWAHDFGIEFGDKSHGFH